MLRVAVLSRLRVPARFRWSHLSGVSRPVSQKPQEVKNENSRLPVKTCCPFFNLIGNRARAYQLHSLLDYFATALANARPRAVFGQVGSYPAAWK